MGHDWIAASDTSDEYCWIFWHEEKKGIEIDYLVGDKQARNDS